MNRSHPYSPGRRNPTPMADLVELLPTIKEAKKKHGGSKARGKIIKVETKGK